MARSSSAVTASSYHDRDAIPAQRSQSGNHGAHERPHERQRPIVGDSDLDAEPRDDARGGGLLERRGPLDRDPADVRVLEREPAQDARLATGLLGVLERRAAQRAPCRAGT